MDQIEPHPATWWKPAIIALLGVAMASLVIAQISWLNGSWYWRWPYRDRASLPALRWYGPMLLAATPLMAAWILPPRSRTARVLAIALLMLGSFAMKLVSVYVIPSPPGFEQLAAIVRSPDATSYYSDAAALQDVDGALAIYPEFISLPTANLHTRSKPPGAVMFYLAIIRALGFGDSSAIIAGIVLGAIATFSIPATYCLTTLFTPDRFIAMIAATLLAMCPGFILHFPTLDATYPIFACAMIGFWNLSLARNDWRFAIAFGLLLALATFITYNLLVLGALLAAWSIWLILIQQDRHRAVATTIRCALLAIITFVAAYMLLWLVSGFNPIATFRAALANQTALLTKYADQRPYPPTIWFDLVDFAFGFGWIVLVPVILGVIQLRRRDTSLFWLSIFAIAMPIVVAVLALLQSETSRVWIFMLPAFLLPAAVEMRLWSTSSRAIVYATMLLIVLAIGHNMLFLIP